MTNHSALWRLRVATLTASTALAFLIASGFASPARADSDRSSPPPLPVYKAECAACHIAYPAGLLGAQSWHQLMANLPKHFGTDASLNAATAKQISTWLQANAGTGRRFSEAPPEHRISKSSWFVREHDEVSASVFRRASVGSAANCSACHPNAAEGSFDEHAVRIPK